MAIRNYLLLIIFFAFGSCKEKPPGSKNQLTLEIDSLFHGSLCVSKSGEIIFQYHKGISNRVWNIPIDQDTRYDIASVNKSFVAGLILIARQDGLLSLDDHLETFFPDFGFDSTITITQMLTHTSGLPDYDGVPEALAKDGFREFKRKHFSNQDYANFISSLEPRFEPGTDFYYSNFAYHLLCIILENVYGKGFPQILIEKICEPLGMENTCSSVDNQELIPGLSIGYHWNEEGNYWKSNNFIDLTLGRRIFSSATDLQKWGTEMIEGSLFKAENHELLTSNHLSDLNSNISYGFGWVVYGKGEKYPMGDLGIDDPYLIHGGATESFKSMVVVIPEREIVFSMLSNHGSNLDELNFTKNIIQQIIQNENQ